MLVSPVTAPLKLIRKFAGSVGKIHAHGAILGYSHNSEHSFFLLRMALMAPLQRSVIF